MITGVVTPNHETIIRLRVRGSQEIEMAAVLDTGFTEFLSLPLALIAALALSYVTLDRVMLADGSVVTCHVYEATVLWDGHARVVSVHAAQGAPLIGMSLLYDHLLAMEVVDGGAVTIEALP